MFRNTNYQQDRERLEHVLKKTNSYLIKKKGNKLKNRPATIVTSIRMLPSLKEKLEKLAQADQRTTNSLIVRALTHYVNRDDWR